MSRSSSSPGSRVAVDERDRAVESALRRVRRGDRAAFAEVIRHHEGPLRSWLAVHAPPGVDVDEIAQRSFVEAFVQLDRFELGTAFGAWLFALARYQLRTERTRLARVADYHARFAPELFVRELERRDGEDPVEFDQRLEHLRHCLETLGEHLRRFLTWRYEDELPLAEMARRSGRSVPAVKKQLFKLRRRLEACVDDRLTSEGAAT